MADGITKPPWFHRFCQIVSEQIIYGNTKQKTSSMWETRHYTHTLCMMVGVTSDSIGSLYVSVISAILWDNISYTRNDDQPLMSKSNSLLTSVVNLKNILFRFFRTCSIWKFTWWKIITIATMNDIHKYHCESKLSCHYWLRVYTRIVNQMDVVTRLTGLKELRSIDTQYFVTLAS